jgi:hypothetical protein
MRTAIFGRANKQLKRDQKLVSLFFDEYKKISGEAYQVKEWVDDKERNKPAVEAIAVGESTGKSLAIEHTLLQPFEGEKEDTQRFLAAIGKLEEDDSLKLPEYMINIGLPVGALPKGIDWADVNKTLEKWIRDNIANIPDEPTKYNLQHNDVEIQIGVSRMRLPHDDKGKLFFSREVPPDSLLAVMRTSLNKKLPKLVGTDADKHILLFENDGILHVNAAIHNAIGKLVEGLPDLKKVDEIWLIGTMGWDSHDYLTFTKVWPDVATWVNGQLQ